MASTVRTALSGFHTSRGTVVALHVKVLCLCSVTSAETDVKSQDGRLAVKLFRKSDLPDTTMRSSSYNAIMSLVIFLWFHPHKDILGLEVLEKHFGSVGE